MKIKRYKKVNKTINYYVNNFNFRKPYQLLVDGTFCHAALQNQINIADNIPRYLHGEVKFLTTPCAIIEMQNLGKKLSGAMFILKNYKTHTCGHEGRPISAAKCLASMLGSCNENHYLIATQDRELQKRVRQIPAVPLLYLHGKTPVLEQPSEATAQLVRDKMAGLTDVERKAIADLKTQNDLAQEETPKKKRKKKGPNPLSCKKKKRLGNVGKVVKKDVEKVKRKKIRIPKHVKEELLKKTN